MTGSSVTLVKSPPLRDDVYEIKPQTLRRKNKHVLMTDFTFLSVLILLYEIFGILFQIYHFNAIVSVL